MTDKSGFGAVIDTRQDEVQYVAFGNTVIETKWEGWTCVVDTAGG